MMTADQLEKAMGYLERWMDQRILQFGSGSVGSGWHFNEMNEMKENFAAAVLGLDVEDLPEPLQFTAHE